MSYCKTRKDPHRILTESASAGLDHDYWNWCCRVGFYIPFCNYLQLIIPSLNLATANRVFLVEPQWNPSVENQAIARALRLGQEQAVQVTRYIVNGTVEQVGAALVSAIVCTDHAGYAFTARQEVKNGWYGLGVTTFYHQILMLNSALLKIACVPTHILTGHFDCDKYEPSLIIRYYSSRLRD